MTKISLASHRLSLEAIERASQLVDSVFLNSPQFECEPLSDRLGCVMTIKLETANPIRSFKGRGADYFMTELHARGDQRALVCASAGNFGQAMAFACRKHKRKLTVFVSKHANALKVERMASLGAEIRTFGEDLDEAKDAAKEYANSSGAFMVEDGLEPEISEGAGSVAVELLANNAAYDTILVPLGNGALLTGIGRWIKEKSPATKVIGVSAKGADAMEKSWRHKKIISSPSISTIADGIAIRVPIPEAVNDMTGIVDEVLLVDDNETEAAMKLLYEAAGLLVEPAGAVGVAACMSNAADFAGKKVATILCGSNLPPDMLPQWSPNSQ